MQTGKFGGVDFEFNASGDFAIVGSVSFECDILNLDSIETPNVGGCQFEEKLLDIRLYNAVETMCPRTVVGRAARNAEIHIVIGVIDEIGIECRLRQCLDILGLETKHEVEHIATFGFYDRKLGRGRCLGFGRGCFGHGHILKRRCVADYHAFAYKYGGFETLVVNICHIAVDSHHSSTSDSIEVAHCISYFHRFSIFCKISQKLP